MGIYKRKNKLKVILILFGIIILYSISSNNKQDKIDTYTDEQIKTREFQKVEGVWKVSKYLGTGLGVKGGEPVTEADRKKEEQFIKEIIQKYLYEEIVISKENLEIFGPPCELGYNYDTWEKLRDGYFRARTDVGYEPPFICISFRLKHNEDNLDMVIGSNGVTVLIVNDEYFLIEKQIYYEDPDN